MADIIIILILLGISALIICSILKNRKKGGCHGNCSCCGGCSQHDEKNKH
ncbi:MAG: FeoB-associated Cys-rich membrane protein [Akkermansia sp.]|nr:FeoB-associated Cys-rich membrane protein [Akkermansia sp.]